MKKRELFKIEGDKITRLRRNCPKCGHGVFLAEHKNRLSCGSCGYTEFKGKREKPVEPKPEIHEEPEKPEIKEEKTEEETVESPPEPEKEETTVTEEPEAEEPIPDASEEKPDQPQK